jgi:hypothetical protein
MRLVEEGAEAVPAVGTIRCEEGRPSQQRLCTLRILQLAPERLRKSELERNSL